MITEKHTYTYDDYEKLPEGAPYQLIGGELVKSPSPVPYHQGLTGKLYEIFLPLKEAGKGRVYFAPIDIYLKDTETYQPDLIFISAARLKIIGKKKIEGAPDIVAEVLSPSTAYYDLRHKREEYRKAGVREYWIVDPMEASIEIYENTGDNFDLYASARGKGSVRSGLYPEIEVDAEEFFRE